jgi:hypothetical protein
MKFYVFGTQNREEDYEDFDITFMTTDAKEAQEYRKTFKKLYDKGDPDRCTVFDTIQYQEIHYNFSFKKALKELKQLVKDHKEE